MSQDDGAVQEHDGDMSDAQEALEAFQRDYLALCERHGLMLAFDGGYTAREVIPYNPDDFAELGLRRAR